MNKRNHHPGKTLLLLVPFSFISLGSCSKKACFATSSIVPAARGYVRIKKDTNENYIIELRISDLAEVERLQAGKRTYVVWETSGDENTRNIGESNSSSKRFSKNLSASFRSVSAAKPEKIFITADENGAVEAPDNLVVLTLSSSNLRQRLFSSPAQVTII